MSEFHVQVVELGKVGKHPNADTLSITQVLGSYPVIFRTGDFKPGDRAVYVPVDAVVPLDDPRFSFLDRPRIKARRLRGIFSMGLLVPADPAWVPGQDVRNELRIEKYEPALERALLSGEDEADPEILPVYTDLEGLRRYSHVIEEGEEVVLTEKVHGTNGRWLWKDGRLWVGSRQRIKKQSAASVWWLVAEKYGLADKLRSVEGIAVYGEVYGPVQDLRYGTSDKLDLKLALFDALDTATRRYLDYDAFVTLADKLDLPRVPVLYRGPWNQEQLRPLANGKTTIGGDHCREGFVVRPVVERWHYHLGRVILKMVGEDYLLRKEDK